MATATKTATTVVFDKDGGAVFPVDLDAHEAEKARCAAELEAKHEESIKCLNPAYAAHCEMAKPQYRWTVSAKWLGPHNDEIVNKESEQVVIAQNEADAWAMFCDKIGEYPSPREAKRTIKRGRQVSMEQIVASRTSGGDAESVITTVKIEAKPKQRGR